MITAWTGRAVVGGRHKAGSGHQVSRSPATGRQRGAEVAPHSPATWHCSQMTFALRSLGVGAFTALACATSRSGQDCGAMEITERPPTRLDLPGREEPVYIATQRWALEPWEGEDPPSLARI
jgi:hypothetical protein